MLYKNMTEHLKPAQSGDFSLVHCIVEPDNFGAIIRGIPPGTYINLRQGETIVMSDTPMEKRTNREFVLRAFGDVLIGGLGIGLILLAIQDKPQVKSITVIEKNKDVIDIVASQLPLSDKVKIIHDDVYTYKPEPRQRFDIIYLDIWNWINSDIWEKEMKPLKFKYRKYLKSKKENDARGVFCWAEYEAKHNENLY